MLGAGEVLHTCCFPTRASPAFPSVGVGRGGSKVWPSWVSLGVDDCISVLLFSLLSGCRAHGDSFHYRKALYRALQCTQDYPEQICETLLTLERTVGEQPPLPARVDPGGALAKREETQPPFLSSCRHFGRVGYGSSEDGSPAGSSERAESEGEGLVFLKTKQNQINSPLGSERGAGFLWEGLTCSWKVSCSYEQKDGDKAWQGWECFAASESVDENSGF